MFVCVFSIVSVETTGGAVLPMLLLHFSVLLDGNEEPVCKQFLESSL